MQQAETGKNNNKDITDLSRMNRQTSAQTVASSTEEDVDKNVTQREQFLSTWQVHRPGCNFLQG